MIRKKGIDGEAVLSVETEDEFGKALATGEAVELTRELADQLGMMEDDTITWAEAKAARGFGPLRPPIWEARERSIMGAGREVWVKVRASEAERAEWHAKARSVGLSLSDLVRRSVGRVRTWTVAHAELERERTRELARIGSNLNQIARWANIHKENAEVVEVVAHLVAIERALDTLTVEGEPR